MDENMNDTSYTVSKRWWTYRAVVWDRCLNNGRYQVPTGMAVHLALMLVSGRLNMTIYLCSAKNNGKSIMLVEPRSILLAFVV